MEYNIRNGVATKQIPGMGTVVSTIAIQLDLTDYLMNPLAHEFILRLEFMFKNRNYYFVQIYSLHDIDQNKQLIIGGFTVLGLYTDMSQIENIKVTITYIGVPIQ